MVAFSRKLLKLSPLLLFISLNMSFQTIPVPKWNIDRDSYQVLWIKPSPSFLDSLSGPNEFPEGQNPYQDLSYAEMEAPEQKIQMLKYIINQYNSISTSFLRLQLHPVEGYDFDLSDSDDIPWVEEEAKNRTIELVEDSLASGGSGGEARPEASDGHMVACTVAINGVPDVHNFLRVILHELGHCLGLAHSHNDKDAVMGYNLNYYQNYLGLDDQMGITYLYPSKEEYGQEAATLGLACSRSK